MALPLMAIAGLAGGALSVPWAASGTLDLIEKLGISDFGASDRFMQQAMLGAEGAVAEGDMLRGATIEEALIEQLFGGMGRAPDMGGLFSQSHLAARDQMFLAEMMAEHEEDLRMMASPSAGVPGILELGMAAGVI